MNPFKSVKPKQAYAEMLMPYSILCFHRGLKLQVHDMKLLIKSFSSSHVMQLAIFFFCPLSDYDVLTGTSKIRLCKEISMCFLSCSEGELKCLVTLMVLKLCWLPIDSFPPKF